MITASSLTVVAANHTNKRRQFTSSRDEYIRKMQAKLEEWNAEIDKLSAKAGDVTAEVKIEYSDHIESLKAKQATFVTLTGLRRPEFGDFAQDAV